MNETDIQARIAAVGAYAAEVMGRRTDSVSGVSRFEAGNRHAVYKVSFGEGSEPPHHVVVRLSHSDEPAECARGEWESAVLGAVGGVAGPRVYDFRCSSPWFATPVMCVEFLPGQALDAALLGLDQIDQLGAVVRYVHARPTAHLVGPMRAAGSLSSYAESRLGAILAYRAWIRDPVPATLQARVNRILSVLEAGFAAGRQRDSFESCEPLVLLHGDVATGNILWGPDPVLIDWEYARIGDPSDEIAYTFDQNGFTVAHRDAFWRGYARGADDQSGLDHIRDRVAWWEPLTLFGSTLWWLERWVRHADARAKGTVDANAPRDAAYYLDQVIVRLDRMDRLLAGGGITLAK